MLEFDVYIKIFLGVFAIMGPYSLLPIFIDLTQHKSKQEKNDLAKRATIAGFLVAFFSVWIGSYILGFFNISIPAFRVAGGMLLLISAFGMLSGKVPGTKQTPEELKEAQISNRDLAIVPMAIPLIIGPGAISTIIVFSSYSSSFVHLAIMSIIVLIPIINIFVFLKIAVKISDKLGLIGINVITRLMGLILASIGVEFMASGLIKLFPGWA